MPGRRMGAALVAVLVGTAPAWARTPADTMARMKAMERYRAGQQYLLSDAFEKAAQEFRAAIELDPSLPLGHYGLGQANMGLRNYMDAVRAFTRCRQVYEELGASSVDDGLRMNRWVEDELRALKDLRLQIETRIRQSSGGNFQLQRALSQVTQRITQLEHLRQRQDQTSTVPAGVDLALGSAYLRAGQLAEAEREYLAALQGNPRMGEAHNNLAYVYMVTGRLADADRALKLAEKNGFKVNPQFKEELKQKQQ